MFNCSILLGPKKTEARAKRGPIIRGVHSRSDGEVELVCLLIIEKDFLRYFT